MRQQLWRLGAEVEVPGLRARDLRDLEPIRPRPTFFAPLPPIDRAPHSETSVRVTPEGLTAGGLLDDLDEDAVWLITGAASGVGRVAAETALRHGQRVVATAEQLGALGPLIDSFGSSVFPIELDVNDESADRESVARSLELFGRVDVVVNNAGFDDPTFDLASDRALERVRTNLFGSLWVSQSVLGFMEGVTGGRIVLVFAAVRGESQADGKAFDAAMRAFGGFGEHLAREVAPFGIKISICVPAALSGEWLAATESDLCEVHPFEIW